MHAGTSDPIFNPSSLSFLILILLLLLGLLLKKCLSTQTGGAPIRRSC